MPGKHKLLLNINPIYTNKQTILLSFHDNSLDDVVLVNNIYRKLHWARNNCDASIYGCQSYRSIVWCAARGDLTLPVFANINIIFTLRVVDAVQNGLNIDVSDGLNTS